MLLRRGYTRSRSDSLSLSQLSATAELPEISRSGDTDTQWKAERFLYRLVLDTMSFFGQVFHTTNTKTIQTASLLCIQEVDRNFKVEEETVFV